MVIRSEMKRLISILSHEDLIEFKEDQESVMRCQSELCMSHVEAKMIVELINERLCEQAN